MGIYDNRAGKFAQRKGGQNSDLARLAEQSDTSLEFAKELGATGYDEHDLVSTEELAANRQRTSTNLGRS